MFARLSPCISTSVHPRLFPQYYYYLQCESKKIPPEDWWQFFQNGWEFFNQILCAYYAFLSTLDYSIVCSFNEVMPY